MNAVQLQLSVDGRSRQLAQAVRQYLQDAADSKSVHIVLGEIINEAETDERWNLQLAEREEALWCLVWSAQHLCGPNHTRTLARRTLEPVLQAFEEGKALPVGAHARRPRAA